MIKRLLLRSLYTYQSWFLLILYTYHCCLSCTFVCCYESCTLMKRVGRLHCCHQTELHADQLTDDPGSELLLPGKPGQEETRHEEAREGLRRVSGRGRRWGGRIR